MDPDGEAARGRLTDELGERIWLMNQHPCVVAPLERLGHCGRPPARRPTKPGAKFPRLLNCGDAAVNRGATLIAVATANGSFIQTPG